jgi:predicted nucleic acid-binding protein
VILLDTSVLVAIAQVTHSHHRPSLELWNGLGQRKTVVSTHTLAETYATLTAMTPSLRLTPQAALLTIDAFLNRLTPVSLSFEEYMETLKRTAALGHTSGMIYDALHLACARKVDAQQIFTWNVRNFRSLAPDLASRITTP